MEYKVITELHIDADSPEAAADTAQDILRDPERTANIFHVLDASGHNTVVVSGDATPCGESRCWRMGAR